MPPPPGVSDPRFAGIGIEALPAEESAAGEDERSCEVFLADATKAAVTCLSQAPRCEFGPRDVRVTDIEPGIVESELRTHNEDAEPARQVADTVDEVGALSAEELADLVACVTSRPRRGNPRQVVALPTRQV